jgi:hypothetical protein
MGGFRDAVYERDVQAVKDLQAKKQRAAKERRRLAQEYIVAYFTVPTAPRKVPLTPERLVQDALSVADLLIAKTEAADD